jgi:hypothetical protein
MVEAQLAQKWMLQSVLHIKHCLRSMTVVVISKTADFRYDHTVAN